MTLQIELLSPEREEEYEAFVASCPEALLYYSLRYRDFLLRVLQPCESHYLVALEAGRLVGALPSFLKRNRRFGNVLNSLPFFGSHGGLIVSPTADQAERVCRDLLASLQALAAGEQVVASTLISNPLAPHERLYREHIRFSFTDQRIGQMASLPSECRDEGVLLERLMGQLHHKTRNCVRKAQKSGVQVVHDDSLAALRELADLHGANMKAIGGLSKPWEVFAAIREGFTYDRDYRVYRAIRDGTTIAGLLVFFFGRAAEYFTPATRPEYRMLQPASLLVFEAMREAAHRGCLRWNWGGTWKTQDGVYQFKKRWGTTDLPYTYYVTVSDRAILEATRAELLAEYPYFYVVPFAELRDTGAAV